MGFMGWFIPFLFLILFLWQHLFKIPLEWQEAQFNSGVVDEINGQAKNSHEKDTHVYKNCFLFESIISGCEDAGGYQ